MLRFALAFPAVFLLCLAATAVIAQAPQDGTDQGHESFQAIEYRFLVQQAIDAGLDAEKTGRMRDILATHRKARRETLELIGQGRITRAEMRNRARKIGEDRDKAPKALLGGKIYAVLDRRKAAAHATGVMMDRPSMQALMTGKQILDYCDRRDDERSRSYCHGYIAAAVDSRLAPGSGGRRFCIPDRIFLSRGNPLDAFLWAVKQHLTKTPADRARVGFEAATEALVAAFPC